MTTKTPSSLSEALAIFQSKVKAADKNGKAKFPQPRTYSLLEDVIKALQPATELGLSHTQTFDYVPLEGGNVLTVLITTIYFKDQKLESKLPLKDMDGNNVYHDLGIAITYSRRYALAAAYGIGSEHDDDAESITQPPKKEKGTRGTPTKPKQKLAPVSEKAKTHPPITTEARELVVNQLKELNALHPEKARELADSYKKEFNVPKVIGHITEARHGEFLALAISKIDESL
nr:phage single-strand DNA binding protein [uncultured Mediterranean phage uvMED]BAR38583.1 phage single-strand DNA binding protein [uncultured Mediterranean phage uvMED]